MVAETRTLEAGLTERPASVWRIFAVLAATVVVITAVQFSRVADFQKFAFYDEGAWLHLDALVAGGAVPTRDVGYSYGMLPLIVGRAWFAVFSRTPWAFIAFVFVCNLWTAWGMASILAALPALKAKFPSLLVLAVLFLWHGIFPNNYSLMHPLEMTLITTALAMQMRGRLGAALAFATLAVLGKPTMGYVLGLLLLLLAAWFKKGWRVTVVPTLTGIAAGVVIWLTLGMRPLIANLIPLTGGKSYQQMNFGIFRAGKSFWWPENLGAWSLVHHYFFTPSLFWIVGSFFIWAMGALALRRLMTREESPGGRSAAVLATIAILHAVFVFLLYAWSGSWTYYAYLLILGVLVALSLVRDARAQRVMVVVFAVLATGALSERLGDSWKRWTGTTRPAEAKGLWTYPDYFQEAERARAMAIAAGPGKSVWLVHGALNQLWPEARVPPSWFLSPGIATESELAAMRALIRSSDVVVLCVVYDPRQEAWNWPEFAEETRPFEVAWEGKEFRVMRRVGVVAP